jgi:hypothetical protein
MKPPPLPSEVLRRVLRMAKFDGISVLAVAGAGALISAAMSNVTGSVIGLIVAGAGAIELHGAGMLRVGDGRGMRWLVSSQVYLMTAVMGYVASRLLNPDIGPLHMLVTSELADQIQQAGMTVDQYLLEVLRLVYVSFAVVTFVYQGGMIVYYLRRRAAVATALQEEASQ